MPQTDESKQAGRRKVMELLVETLQADIHFISENPKALFQSFWNKAWWYDCIELLDGNESPGRLDAAERRRRKGARSSWLAILHLMRRRESALSDAGNSSVAALMESWRRAVEGRRPPLVWLRSLRPPVVPLGSAQTALLRGHAACVQTVAFTSDGRRIVTGSGDSVRVWDADSSLELLLASRASSPSAVSPGGRTFATGDYDGIVHLWDAETGEELRVLRGHIGPVACLAFSPDGGRMVSGGGCRYSEWGAEVDLDPTVRVWEIDGGREQLCLTAHKKKINSVGFSPDGESLISASAESVRICDSRSGNESFCRLYDEYNDGVNCAALSPDGRLIAIGAIDRVVRILDAGNGANAAICRGHGDQVFAVAFFPDSARVVSGSHDQTIRIWNARSGKQLAEFSGHEGAVWSVDVSPDGSRLVSGSNDCTARVWRTGGGAPPGGTTHFQTDIQSVAFITEGRVLAAASLDKAIHIWDTPRALELSRIDLDFYAHVVAVSQDERRIACGGGLRLVVLDAETGAPRSSISFGLSEGIKSLAFSPDGTKLACGTENDIKVFDAQSGELLISLSGTMGYVERVAFSSDGARVISGHGFKPGVWHPETASVTEHFYDYSIRVWEVTTGTELAQLRGHTGSVIDLACSGKGALIVSVSEDETTRVWDAATLACIRVFKGRGDAKAIADGPDRFPFLAFCERLETRVESSATSEQVARIPTTLKRVITHPTGRTWAGYNGKHLFLFSLEGVG